MKAHDVLKLASGKVVSDISFDLDDETNIKVVFKSDGTIGWEFAQKKIEAESSTCKQQTKATICSDPTVPYGVCGHAIRMLKEWHCTFKSECPNKQ